MHTYLEKFTVAARPDWERGHVPCLSRKEGVGPRQSGAYVGMGVPRWDSIVAISPQVSVSMSCDRRDRRSARQNGTGAGLRLRDEKTQFSSLLWDHQTHQRDKKSNAAL